MTRLEVADLPADRLPGDLLAVPLFEDLRTLDGPAAVVDWRLNGALSRMLIKGEITGRIGERLALQGNSKLAVPWVLVGGSGRWSSLEQVNYAAIVRRLLKVVNKTGVAELALCLPPTDSVAAPDVERIVREVLAGMNRPAICRLSRISRFV